LPDACVPRRLLRPRAIKTSRCEAENAGRESRSERGAPSTERSTTTIAGDASVAGERLTPFRRRGAVNCVPERDGAASARLPVLAPLAFYASGEGGGTITW